MSGRPVIGWVDKDLNPLSKLTYSGSADGSASAVIADSESAHVIIGITNNFTKGTAAAEAVQDANECQLRITSTTGTTDIPVVKEGWIYGKCLTDSAQSNFTQLGLVGAPGDDSNPTEVLLNVTAGDASAAQTIKGTANDGADATTGFNVAKIELYAKPLSSTEATGGVQQFRTTLIYSYGATA